MTKYVARLFFIFLPVSSTVFTGNMLGSEQAAIVISFVASIQFSVALGILGLDKIILSSLTEKSEALPFGQRLFLCLGVVRCRCVYLLLITVLTIGLVGLQSQWSIFALISVAIALPFSCVTFLLAVTYQASGHILISSFLFSLLNSTSILCVVITTAVLKEYGLEFYLRVFVVLYFVATASIIVCFFKMKNEYERYSKGVFSFLEGDLPWFGKEGWLYIVVHSTYMNFISVGLIALAVVVLGSEKAYDFQIQVRVFGVLLVPLAIFNFTETRNIRRICDFKSIDTYKYVRKIGMCSGAISVFMFLCLFMLSGSHAIFESVFDDSLFWVLIAASCIMNAFTGPVGLAFTLNRLHYFIAKDVFLVVFASLFVIFLMLLGEIGEMGYWLMYFVLMGGFNMLLFFRLRRMSLSLMYDK